MRVVRRRLFKRIYLTLIASLVAATVIMGGFLWFLGEAQREVAQSASHQASHSGLHRPHGVADVSLYAADGRLLGTRGELITPAERAASRGQLSPPYIVRLALPGGGFVLARLGPSPGTRALRFLIVMLTVAGGGALTAYPVAALLTRRLEALRAGVARWGEDGVPTRLDESGQDEVALLARAFNGAAGRLAGLLASQKALLANASHELRSPLARLRIAVDLGLGEASPAMRSEIVRSLAEMDALVEELLLSSRLDHPESRRDHREPVDLLGLAAEEALHHDADVAGTPVEVAGDPVLLQRLIRNLLDNAAKHGRPPIAVIVEHEGDAATITVSDAGRSIAPEQRERIFDPFYRPKGSGEVTGGWGLGLALVRQIAELHDGSISCDAAPAGGTRFMVRLAASR